MRLLALLFGSFLAVVGTLHFLRPAFFVRQVPPYVPHAAAAVLLTGFAEVAIGLALIADWRPSLAGVAAAALITSYLPVHIGAPRRLRHDTTRPCAFQLTPCTWRSRRLWRSVVDGGPVPSRSTH